MKKQVVFSILVVALLALVCVSAYRMVMVPKPRLSGNASEPSIIGKLMDTLTPEPKPSPYSIKWGATMARVVDQDGNGVAGATVTFEKHLRRDCDGNTTETPPEWQGTTVITNETGEFTYPPEIWQFEDPEKKPTIWVNIEAKGFLSRKSASVGINYADDNGEIDLFRVGRIEGAIIDPNGQPLVNVPLRFNTHTYYKNPGASCSGCFSANIKTDEAGGFVIEKAPPGQHIIKFPGHAGGCGQDEPVEVVPFKEYATFKRINMKDGDVRSDVFLDLRQPRGTIKGKVVDKYNRPMAEVNAILYREIKHYDKDGSGWSSFTEHLKSVPTDENGNYILDHIPTGDYQLQAQYPYEKGQNYRSGDPLNIYLAGKQEVTFNLVLERQDDNLPKPDCRERSLFEAPLPDDLGPRDMMIVDPRGEGIPNASVVFDKSIKLREKDSNQTTSLEWDGASLKTDSRGVFVLPKKLEEFGPKWVQCRVTIKAEGFEQRQVSLGLWNLKEDRRIDILPLSEIRGQLVGADGNPVKGNISGLTEMTSHHNPGSSSSGGRGLIQVTGKDGRFTLSQVPEGTHVLRYEVEKNETNSRHTGGVVIYTQGKRPVDNIVIDLRQDTCLVRGRALDWDGKPLKNATVRLSKSVRWGHESFGQSTSSVEIYRSEKSNRKGEYVIENIRPGVYEIEAVFEGDRRRTSEKMTIALGEDQAIELDIRLKR